jgi:hypothetical protein
MDVRNRRAARPTLERVEERELLSGVMASMVARQPRVPSAIAQLSAQIAAGQRSSAGVVPVYSGNTAGVGNGNALHNNPNSPLLGNGTPTPAELRRETFKANFSGRFYTGPGRFTNQGTTYYFRGLGGSSMFLHGDFNMAVITPTDPNLPFFGLAVLNDKSTNSSGILAFDLTADRTSVDALGRPTRLTGIADPNIYSGLFFVSAAQVTADIRYGANNAISVTFHGLVFTNGLTNPLVNSDLYARHGRPLRFHGH